jgi:hypothetical protein
MSQDADDKKARSDKSAKDFEEVVAILKDKDFKKKYDEK